MARAVFISKPSEISFAEAMSRLRMWLDNKKIQPTAFRVSTDKEIGFEIGFNDDNEATIFNAGFEWRLPPI